MRALLAALALLCAIPAQADLLRLSGSVIHTNVLNGSITPALPIGTSAEMWLEFTPDAAVRRGGEGCVFTHVASFGMQLGAYTIFSNPQFFYGVARDDCEYEDIKEMIPMENVGYVTELSGQRRVVMRELILGCQNVEQFPCVPTYGTWSMVINSLAESQGTIFWDTVVRVYEPSTLGLIAVGLLAVSALGRKSRRR